jgi:4-hydroxy-tetrahydrodipicolinate synthase
MINIKGVVVPLVTPLTASEDVDVAAVRRIVDFLISQGVHVIFALGTTGEFARLEERQKWLMLETCVEAVGGRVPVYAGVSDCGTRRVRSNLRQARALGADLAVCTLPFYFPVHNPDEQLLFFHQVLEDSPLPVMIYNIPVTIGATISPAVVETLAAQNAIAGIKDSGGDLAYLAQIIATRRRYNLPVLAGAEKVGRDALLMGADGLVPSLANVFPRLFVGLYKACQAGDAELSARFQAKIDEINRFNTCTNSWMGLITFRKKALSLLGLCDEQTAEPYLKLDQPTLTQIKALVTQMETWTA